MIKVLNRNNGKFFLSFHLEVLILKVFNNVNISDYSSGVRFFFDKVRALVTQPIYDPAGYGGNVGKYIDTPNKIQEASYKLQLAYEHALNAESSANR